MKKVVKANTGNGWVIWDGVHVPTEWFPTKKEAEVILRQDRALEEAQKGAAK